MQYWQFEALIVAAILSAVAYVSGGKVTDWTCAVAVLLTFMHGQLSFDLQESQDQLPKPTVPMYKWSGRFFIMKEAVWITTFALLHAWPLLAGTLVFASYPTWRKWFRQHSNRLNQAQAEPVPVTVTADVVGL